MKVAHFTIQVLRNAVGVVKCPRKKHSEVYVQCYYVKRGGWMSIFKEKALRKT